MAEEDNRAEHRRDPLFAAALQVALERGVVKKAELVSRARSHRSASSYLLMSDSGRRLARIPMSKVQRCERKRRALVRRLGGKGSSRRVSAHTRRKQLQKRPNEERALAWALSLGEPVPSGRFGLGQWILAIVLLLLGVLPGLLYLAWALPRSRRYGEAMESLVVRWQASHRPDPAEGFFGMEEGEDG